MVQSSTFNRSQWQLLQLVLEQPEQPPEGPDAGVKLPPLLKPHADMRRLTFVPLQ